MWVEVRTGGVWVRTDTYAHPKTLFVGDIENGRDSKKSSKMTKLTVFFFYFSGICLNIWKIVVI